MALLTAIVSLVITYKKYRYYEERRHNEILSKFNQRYLTNEDIQTVVKYLREIDPSDIQPTPYQTEVFLRFFEELGIYLEDKSLHVKDVRNFFDYYFSVFENSQRGKALQKFLSPEDLQTCYLSKYREILTNK